MSAFFDALAKGVVEIEVDDNKMRVQLDKTEREMERAGDRSAKAFKAGFEKNKFDVGEAVAGKSGGAAQGLLALSQAADDLQYGFRGIVNNIPQLVAGLGAGAGVAGAAQLAAIAVNQLVNNWDRLSAAFGEGLPDPKITGKTPEAATVQLAQMDEEIQNLLIKQGGPDGIDAFEEKRLKKMQAVSKDAHERLNASKVVKAHGDLGTKAAQAAGKQFADAMSELPFGSETLMQELTRTMKEGDAEVLVARALKGERGAGTEILGKMPGDGPLGKFKRQLLASNFDAKEKKMREQMGKEAGEAARLRDTLNAEGKANDRRMIEEKFKADAGDVQQRVKNLQALKDKQEEIAAGRNLSQTFSGAKSYVGAAQTSAMNQIPKQQLDAIKTTNTLLQKANTELEGLRKQRDEALARFAK